jgi:HAD superfamily hydrolase (TIGR01509 family)
MPKIQAIFFDLDGTLLDSREAVIPAYTYALQQHKVPVPEPDDMKQYAHSLRSLRDAVAPHVPYDELLATYDARQQELLHTIHVYDGVAGVLGTLRSDFKLGVVSSARRASEALEQHGLRDFFDVVVGGLDVTQRKPHPEPVRLALGRLSVRPENAVMVGDLAADVLAARAAGIGVVIGVTHGFGSRKVLEAAGADYVVDDFPAVLRTIESLS